MPVVKGIHSGFGAENESPCFLNLRRARKKVLPHGLAKGFKFLKAFPAGLADEKVHFGARGLSLGKPIERKIFNGVGSKVRRVHISITAGRPRESDTGCTGLSTGYSRTSPCSVCVRQYQLGRHCGLGCADAAAKTEDKQLQHSIRGAI
jgi:hypothetical protein